MKKRFALPAIFTTLLILACMTGCNNLTLKEVKPDQAGNPCSTDGNGSEALHTIRGTCGENQSGSSARTVFPSASTGNVDHYVIKATRASDSEVVTARTVQGENTFSISLQNGTWQLQAYGYKAAGEAGETAENLVLQSDTKSITLSDETLSETTSITLVVKPLQTDSGSGSIAVHVGFENSLPIQEVGIRLDNGDEIFRYPESSAIDFKPVNHTIDNVPSGSHTLVISFYDSNHILHYRAIETVNVFDNLCSGNWVDTGNTGHYSTIGSDNQFTTYLVLTQSMVNAFKLTNFYVDPIAGDDSNSGSWIKPFKTFEKALATVKAVSSETTPYTINLAGDVTVSTPPSLETEDSLNLTIQGDGLNSSGKPYSLNFDGYAGFTIAGPGNLTFRNICLKGAETDAGVIDSQSATAQLQYTLEGYVIIEGNLATDGTTVCNLVVPYDTMNDKTKPVRISNTLDSRSRIGVTLSGTQPTANTPVTIAANFSADNNAIPYDVFFSDNNDGIPVLNTDNSVSLARSSGTILAGEDITITMPDYWIQRDANGTGSLDFAVLNAGWELSEAASYSVKLIAKGCTYPFFDRSAYTLNNGKFTISLQENTPEGLYHLNVTVTVNGIRYSASKEILFSKGQPLSDYAATHTTAPSSGQYVICTKEDLDLLRDMTNGTWTPAGASSAAPATSFSGCTLTMFSDIDLENEEWSGIGTYLPSVAFKGTFDGNGHTIKGLNITGTTSGLFGYTDAGATIKNLTAAGTSKGSGIVYYAKQTTINNCTSNIYLDITDITNYSGGIAGRPIKCSITDCTNNGSVTINTSVPSSYCGGIIGDCDQTSVTGCYNYGTITINKTGSNFLIGGIAGVMEGSGCTVTECENHGAINATNGISSTTSLGGITGRMYASTQIKSCNNYGNITINSTAVVPVGGILCAIPSARTDPLIDCKNYGNITTPGLASGIIANSLCSSYFSISGCENSGTITSTDSNAGGIAALNGNYIWNCTNQGTISAKTNAAGIANNDSSTTREIIINNCLNSGTVTVTDSSSAHAAGICTNAKVVIFQNCVNLGLITGTSTYTGGIATGSDLSGSTFTNCFYHYGKVLSGSTFGTGRGSNSAVSDETGNVEQCGPLFTTTGSRLGISPARNGISDIAKLMNDWIKSSSGGNDSSFSSYRQWGYSANGELTFTTYTDYTPFVILPVITSASASSLSGYTSSDTVKIQIPAATTANDINSLLSGNTNNVKIVLDLSNISGSFKDISQSLPNVTELVLPSVTFKDNQFGSDSIGFALDLKKVTIKGDVTGAWTFQKCTTVETVIFAEGVTSVSSGMFSKCTSLKTVVLPSTLTKIGYHAFANSAIEEIIIPANVEEIQHYAFFDSTSSAPVDNLKCVIFEDTTRTWTIKQNGTGEVISRSPIGASSGEEPSVMPSDLTQIDVSDPVKNAEWFKSYLGRTEGYYWVRN